MAFEFGNQSTGTSLFGNTQSVTNTGFTGFGQTSQPNTTSSFGFGSSNTSQSTLGFGGSTPGVLTTQPTIGLGGNTIQNVPNQPAFGLPAKTSASPFGFGSQNTASSNTSGFQLGITPSQPQQQNPSGFNLGSTVSSVGIAPFGSTTSVLSSSTPIGNNATTTTVSVPFGSISSVSTTPVLNLGSNLTSSAPVTSGLSFGTSATTSTPNFGLGTALTIKQTIGSTTTTPTFGFGVSVNTSNPQTASILPNSSGDSSKKGLGGVALSETIGAVKSEVTIKDGVKNAKDLDLQPELKESFDQFKKYIAEIKTCRDEILKSKELDHLLRKVNEDSRNLNNNISEVFNSLQKIQMQSSNLKDDLNKELINIKTAKTPLDQSMHYSTPNSNIKYLSGKAAEFQHKLAVYMKEVEKIQNILSQSFNSQSSQSQQSSLLTPRELVFIIRRVESDFISVAADLYVLNERVRSAKIEFTRRMKSELRSTENFQDPFKCLESKFADPFDKENGRGGHMVGLMKMVESSRDTERKSFKRNELNQSLDGVGSSPFENCRSMVALSGNLAAQQQQLNNNSSTFSLGNFNSGGTALGTAGPFGNSSVNSGLFTSVAATAPNQPQAGLFGSTTKPILPLLNTSSTATVNPMFPANNNIFGGNTDNSGIARKRR